MEILTLCELKFLTLDHGYTHIKNEHERWEKCILTKQQQENTFSTTFTKVIHTFEKNLLITLIRQQWSYLSGKKNRQYIVENYTLPINNNGFILSLSSQSAQKRHAFLNDALKKLKNREFTNNDLDTLTNSIHLFDLRRLKCRLERTEIAPSTPKNNQLTLFPVTNTNGEPPSILDPKNLIEKLDIHLKTSFSSLTNESNFLQVIDDCYIDRDDLETDDHDIREIDWREENDCDNNDFVPAVQNMVENYASNPQKERYSSYIDKSKEKFIKVKQQIGQSLYEVFNELTDTLAAKAPLLIQDNMEIYLVYNESLPYIILCQKNEKTSNYREIAADKGSFSKKMQIILFQNKSAIRFLVAGLYEKNNSITLQLKKDVMECLNEKEERSLYDNLSNIFMKYRGLYITLSTDHSEIFKNIVTTLNDILNEIIP